MSKVNGMRQKVPNIYNSLDKKVSSDWAYTSRFIQLITMSSCVCHITTSVVSPMYKKSHQSSVKKPRCCVLISRCNFAAWCVSDFSEIWWRWNTKFCSNELPGADLRKNSRRRISSNSFASRCTACSLLQIFGVFWWGCSPFNALTPLVGRQEGHRPVKTEWWGAGVVICLERRCRLAYSPADATATHCLLLQ